MKNYLLGLIAVIMAISLNAKVNFDDILIPLEEPLSASVVEDETKYSDSGTGTLGYDCNPPEEAICRIRADSRYTHIDANGDKVFNSPGNTPSGEFYLTITSVAGVFKNGVQYFKIQNVTSNDPTDSKGNGFDWWNGKV